MACAEYKDIGQVNAQAARDLSFHLYITHQKLGSALHSRIYQIALVHHVNLEFLADFRL